MLHILERSGDGWARNWQICPSTAISCGGGGILTDLRYSTSTLPKLNYVRKNSLLPNDCIVCRALIAPSHIPSFTLPRLYLPVLGSVNSRDKLRKTETLLGRLSE
jgi:hypothetical protein